MTNSADQCLLRDVGIISSKYGTVKVTEEDRHFNDKKVHENFLKMTLHDIKHVLSLF